MKHASFYLLLVDRKPHLSDHLETETSTHLEVLRRHVLALLQVDDLEVVLLAHDLQGHGRGADGAAANHAVKLDLGHFEVRRERETSGFDEGMKRTEGRMSEAK